jgi:Ca2+-transporting ATPase
LAEHGANLLPVVRGPGVLDRVLRQLLDPMILLLSGALVLVLAVGDLPDAVIIAAVVVLNTTIGVVQDWRAQRAVDALRDLTAPMAHAWRDGALHTVPAARLVPGDLVRLEAGDIVPADVRLVEATSVDVDESAMTGESLPVGRGRGDELSCGTVLTRGLGLGLVVRTGADSSLGRLAALVGTHVPPTPLQRRLAGLSRQLVVVVGAVCILVGGLAVAQGESWTRAAVLAVSLGVAAVPESLPAVVTISLALGAHRMALRHAVVRRLPAVETLGSVTVIASDKTGTLTPGVLAVRRIWTAAGRCEVPAGTDAPDGPVSGPPPAVAAAARLLRDAALCNDATVTPTVTPTPEATDGGWESVGDPFDVALLVAAARLGITTASLGGWSRVEETPFDARRAWARTVHTSPDGDRVEVVKGAPEAVLDLMVPGPVVEAARVEAERLAEGGERVLAVLEDRRWCGLVSVADPPHPDSADVVARCRAAGIRTVLVTGDHPATAREIARQVGILTTGEVVLGEAVARGDHVDRVEQIEVYARIRPEQKVDIVRAWQARGAVVAMTGDGVNDAPALRAADIGVAMGGRGTEVARQAADLVLTDDHLGTLVEAVAEGRRIHTNIRTFLRYGLAGGLAEVQVLLSAPLVGLAVPLTPAMILWINMVTHGLPGVAFGGEPLDPRVMHRPTPASRSVLDRALLRQIALAGIVMTVTCLVAAGWASRRGEDVQSSVFLTLGLGQLAVAWSLRAPRAQGHGRWHERGLEVAVLLAAGAQLAGVSVPALRDLLGTEAPSWSGLAVVAVLAVLPGAVVAVSRRRARGGTEVPRWRGPSGLGSHPRERSDGAMDNERTHVVVGVGESASGAAALGWAAALCRSRDWDLDVVTAWPDLGEVMVHEVPGHFSMARHRLVSALSGALEASDVAAGDLRVRVHVVNGDPVEALLEHSRDAVLLVVGASGGGRSAVAGQPPVSESCRRSASCPVVVVDDDHATLLESA